MGSRVVVGLKVDSKSTLALIKNPVFHERSKHIQTRFHFIRESLENGEIMPEFISTGGQLVDILTKALPKANFQSCELNWYGSSRSTSLRGRFVRINLVLIISSHSVLVCQVSCFSYLFQVRHSG
jgi:hypothetical protein